MINKLSKIYFIVIIFLLGTINVNAESAVLRIGPKYCYNGYGLYTGGSYCGSRFTYYKVLYGTNNSGNEAYCVQAGMYTPSDGKTMNTVGYGTIAGQTWTEQKALVSGAIMDIIRNQKYDKANETVYIHSALNTYLKFNSSRSYSNTVINNAISTAKSMTFFTSSTLKNTKASIAFSNPILNRGAKSGNVYYYSNVNINIENNYPKSIGNVTYKPQCNNCKLYTDSSMKKEVTEITVAPGEKKNLTYYVRTNNNLAANTKITLSLSATKDFTYTIAKLWYYSSYNQMMITSAPKTYKGSIKTTATAAVPSAKQVYFYKTNSVGDELTGANVKVELTDNNNKSIGSCSTESRSECNFSFTDNITDLNYKITELTSPDGYIKEAEITNKWKVGTNTNTCYRILNTDENSEWTELNSIEDCNTAYLKQEVCLDKEGKILTDIKDSNSCVENNTKEEPEEDESQQPNPTNEEEEDNPEQPNQPTNPPSQEEGEEDQKEPVEIIKNTWETKCLNSNNEIVPLEKCDYDYALLTTTGDNLLLTVTNTFNSLKVKKINEEGKELEGAKLKICTSSDYKEKGTKCEAYTTVNENKLSWYSSTVTQTFYGFKPGTYYLIEEKAPLGYKFDNTIIEFKMDEYGQVTLADNSKAKLNDNTIIFKNESTEFTVSKQDMTTGKELKGATLSICTASNEGEKSKGDYELVLSDDGYCEPVVLSNGEYATWISEDKPYMIKGLAPGAYYLVERIAPTDYSTAESILFFMNSDGTITDKEGKSLKENKLVMKDALINAPKTGDTGIYIVIGLLIAVIGLSTGSSYYLKNGENILKH